MTRMQKIMSQSNHELNAAHIATELFITLDLIDVEDLWHNSGPTRYGYIDPSELAFEMLEEAISPYVEKFRTYLSNSKWQEAKIVCIGILQGLNDFEIKSKSQFKDWAPGVSDTLQKNLLDECGKNSVRIKF